MIEELYDTVLSITNETGYIDRISVSEEKSLLRWSTNNLFPFNTWNIYNPPYTVIVFSHDEFFRTPFSCLIKEDGTYENIYI
jgi:hypothetical protein